MALIEHHRLHIRQRIVALLCLGVEHVAEDLGGHHHHPGFAIHAQVAGHQADILRTKLLTEITQLLVRQRLQRCGVEDLLTMGNRPVDGVFAHQGFT